MKKLLLIILFITPFLCYSQNAIEEVEISNGKTIIIYDNKTWQYKDQSSTTIQPLTSNATNNSSSGGNFTSGSGTRTQSTRAPSRVSSSSTSSYCGARTKKGGSCRRLVKGGGRCYQH